MENLTKQQLTFFKSIIKEVLEFEKTSKIEKDKKDKFKKEELLRIKCLESKEKFRPKLEDIISEVKEMLYYDECVDEEDYNTYNTCNYIRDCGGFHDLKIKVSELVTDFSKSILIKK